MLETPRLSQTLRLSIALLIAVVGVGTLGYVAIEGWSWFDAFYMTITTITTIGGGEPHAMSVPGKWWTIAVVAVGFGVLTYTLLQLLSFTLEGRLSDAVAQRQHRRRVMKMNGHFILCGFGRVGSEIARIFTRKRHDFVIIDINPDSLQRAAAEGYTTIAGDAAETSTLEAAGVQRAAGLIAAVDTDETNIYVTLSARVLNPNLFIVARANRRDAESKLRLAGASRIISPYAIGGSRMAGLAMRPTAVEFVDTVLFGDNSELVLEDFGIPANSSWPGRNVGDLIDEKSAVIVLAVKREGSMQFRPSPQTQFRAGDEIVVAGPPDGIRTVDEKLRT